MVLQKKAAKAVFFRPSKKLAARSFPPKICTVCLLAFGSHGATFQIFDLKRGIPPKAEQHARSWHAASGTANGVRKALLRKAAEPTAHVAGFGTRVRGLRPSNTS